MLDIIILMDDLNQISNMKWKMGQKNYPNWKSRDFKSGQKLALG